MKNSTVGAGVSDETIPCVGMTMTQIEALRAEGHDIDAGEARWYCMTKAEQDAEKAAALERYLEVGRPASNLANWSAFFQVNPKEAAVEWAATHGVTPEDASRRWFEFLKVAPAAHANAMNEWEALIESQAPVLMALYAKDEDPVKRFLNSKPAWELRYNAETTWAELLTGDGWQLHHVDRNGVQHWTRPGKERRKGSSATVGYKGLDKLKVFSGPSWLPVKEKGGYTRWAYTVYRDFDGDWVAASRAARRRYGL